MRNILHTVLRRLFKARSQELLSGSFADLRAGRPDFFVFRLRETRDGRLRVRGGLSGVDSAFDLEGERTANGFSICGEIGGASVALDLVVEDDHAINVFDAFGKALGTWRRVL